MYLYPAPTYRWPTERWAAIREVEPHTERQVLTTTLSVPFITKQHCHRLGHSLAGQAEWVYILLSNSILCIF